MDNGNDKTIIFDDRLIDQKAKVVDPTLELEDNASGTLEFTIYPTNLGYGTVDGENIEDLLVVSSSTVRVEQAGEEIWEGRPLTIGTDFYNGKQISCEGALSYLNDIDQPYKEYSKSDGSRLEIIDFIKGVLTEYNAKASDNRKFYVDGTYVNPIKIPRTYHYSEDQHVASQSNLPQSDVPEMTLYHVDDTDTYWLWYDSKWSDVTSGVHLDLGYRRATGGETTKESIFSLVDSEQYGGHIKVVTDTQGRRCLYYTLAFDPEDYFINGGRTVTKPVQSIEFGKNLIDLIKTRDSTDFFTVLLPVGADISAEHPETIESMCLDVLNDSTAFAGHPLSVSDTGRDLIVDSTVSPYDAPNIYGLSIPTEYTRRVATIDILDGNGYDYFLFTGAYYRNAEQGDSVVYFYTLSDKSAGTARINNTEDMGYTDPGMGTETTYANARTIRATRLGTDITRQVINGEKISVPDKGCAMLSFAISSAYMHASAKSDGSDVVVPDQTPDMTAFRTANKIEYPKVFRAPYPRTSYIDSGLRLVPESDIHWEGTLADPHWETSTSNLPYANLGGDDCDIVIEQETGTVRVTHSMDKSAHYLDRFPPFGTKYEPHDGTVCGMPYPWNEHQGVNKPDWMFLTGYFGHHVARVTVEPGKTYYLNTRVTNPGYPDTSMYTEDVQYAIDVPENQWPFDIDGHVKRRIYNDIFAYAVVAKRKLRNKTTDTESWKYEVLSYKKASNSPVATELMMEKIEIPRATFPENKTGADECIELWFTCDSCYVNGTANLNNNQNTRVNGDPNPVNGYHPSLYVQDSVLAADDSTQRDYHQCVTIAPLNLQQPEGYTNLPREYFVNKELADKYGVIIKRVDFDTALTPTQLMFFTEQAMSIMTGEPSFDVSAVDLMACGLTDCDKLRLMQRIPIETKEHGVNTFVSLSQMSINLTDQSSNTYTLGYEANKGISQM